MLPANSAPAMAFFMAVPSTSSLESSHDRLMDS
jgi:hypothetical protein